MQNRNKELDTLKEWLWSNYEEQAYNQKEIAKRIKEERKKPRAYFPKGLTQGELAILLSVERNTIGAWEKQGEGGRIPPLNDMLIMCKLFGCELGFLLGEYPLPTRKATEICEETGLDDDSIKALKIWNTEGNPGGSEEICKRYIYTINLLLSEDIKAVASHTVLHCIVKYLLAEINFEAIQVALKGDATNDFMTVTKEQLEDVMIFDVQFALKELKKWVESSGSWQNYTMPPSATRDKRIKAKEGLEKAIREGRYNANNPKKK